MKLKDIRKGDVVTYSDGRINHVNRPDKYVIYFNQNLVNKDAGLKIVKIQRYVKCLWFYRLKTIYKRG